MPPLRATFGTTPSTSPLPIPVLTSLSRNAGTVDGSTSIDLVGTGFASGMLCSGGTCTYITSTSATLVTAPGTAGETGITVSTAGGTSNSLSFTYLGHPTITVINPNTSADNVTQAVTVTGTNFPYSYTGVPFSLLVGGLTATGFAASSPTSASGTIPRGGTDGVVTATVTVDGVTTSPGVTYTFTSSAVTPVLTSLSRNAGTADGGTSIDLVGTGFVSPMTCSIASSVVVHSPTSATITTSASGPFSALCTVTTVGGTSNSITYTYLAHPTFVSISPTFGPDNAARGTTVTATNLPFGFTGVPFTITVGGASITPVATSSTTATGTIPSGGSDGAQDVVITVDGKSVTGSGAYTFIGLPAPTLSAMVPDLGNTGTVVTLWGSALSGATVTVGGIAATIATNTGSSITLTIPAGLTAGNYYATAVTTAGGTATLGNGSTTGYAAFPPLIYNWDASTGFTPGASAHCLDYQSGATADTAIVGGTTAPTAAANYNGSGLQAMALAGQGSQGLSILNTVIAPSPIWGLWVGDADTTITSIVAEQNFGNSPGGPRFITLGGNAKIDDEATGGPVIGAGPTPMNAPGAALAVWNGASSETWANGGSHVTGSLNASCSFDGTLMGIGNRPYSNNSMRGHIAQLLYGTGTLSTGLVAFIHGYCQTKWKTP
jgi:hypothetical protein